MRPCTAWVRTVVRGCHARDRYVIMCYEARKRPRSWQPLNTWNHTYMQTHIHTSPSYSENKCNQRWDVHSRRPTILGQRWRHQCFVFTAFVSRDRDGWQSDLRNQKKKKKRREYVWAGTGQGQQVRGNEGSGDDVFFFIVTVGWCDWTRARLCSIWEWACSLCLARRVGGEVLKNGCMMCGNKVQCAETMAALAWLNKKNKKARNVRDEYVTSCGT